MIAAVQTPRTERRKVRVGTVVSNKMEKSILVAIERRVPHPLYKKYCRPCPAGSPSPSSASC
jgi:ribosomal protein S17